MAWKVMFGEIRTKEGDLDTDGNPTVVRYSDTDVNLDDLSPEVFERIAREVDAGLTDTGIYHFPTESVETAYRLVVAAAQSAGIEPPPKPTRMGDTDKLKRMFEQIPDISEQPMSGGYPPELSGVGDGSRPTSPGTTTGPDGSLEPTP